MRRGTALALALCAPILCHAQVHLEIVVDASATMNRRIRGGGTQLTAATDVVATLAAVLPAASPDLHIGLRVFGSQTDASDAEACTDTQLLVPVQPFDRHALIDAVRSIEARGRTPLALALEQAAGDFPADATTRAILLLTDGWDSCDGDVYRAVRALQESEPPIHLQVIGLAMAAPDIKRFSTFARPAGGSSVPDVVKATAEALSAVLELKLEPVPVSVQPIVTQDDTSPQVELISVVSGKALAFPGAEGEVPPTLSPGIYSARLTWPDRVVEIADLGVFCDLQNLIELDLAGFGPASVAVTPETTEAGGTVRASFSGALPGSSWLTVVAEDAPAHDRLLPHSLDRESGEIEVVVPPAAGLYEVRLLSRSANGRLLITARVQLPAVPTTSWVAAPEAVETLTGIEVAWMGPEAPPNLITLVPADAPAEEIGPFFAAAAATPQDILAPGEPCTYELRYLNTTTMRILARWVVEISQPEAELRAPEKILCNAPFIVKWIGPDALNDFITIVAADAADGTYSEWAPTSLGTPLELTAPGSPGTYELRYMSGHGDRVLDRIALEVEGVSVTLEAPATVKAGTRFEVRWTGPDGNGDFISIVAIGRRQGRYRDFSFTSLGSPASLAAPFAPGDYEIRYVVNSDRSTLHSIPIRVD